jgi:transcription termination/antitermination protein NusG
MTQQTQAAQQLNELNNSATTSPRWHALWTRSHSEQLVHDQLANRGFQVFLPTIETWVRRRGMRHRATVPMFNGYLFLHHQMTPQSYVEVSQTRGLVKLLGESWDHLAVVPERDVEAVRRLHASKLPATPHPYLQKGQHVRVVGGLLAGAEGILLRMNPNKGLFVISVDMLQRSVAVEIDCTLVVPA